MPDADRHRLLFGPYRTLVFKYGDVIGWVMSVCSGGLHVRPDLGLAVCVSDPDPGAIGLASAPGAARRTGGDPYEPPPV
jgi:hypothetical protein